MFNIILTSRRDPEISSKSEFSIFILVSRLLVSAFILLEIKSISPLKVLFLKLETPDQGYFNLFFYSNF